MSPEILPKKGQKMLILLFTQEISQVDRIVHSLALFGWVEAPFLVVLPLHQSLE